MKKLKFLLAGALGLNLLLCSAVKAQIPTNFPAITVSVYDSNKVAKGDIFLASLGFAPNFQSHVMILDNTGSPVSSNKFAETPSQAFDFKMQANGQLSYATVINVLPYQGSFDALHWVTDDSVTNVVDTSYSMKNDFVNEVHDFQILPNGHSLLMGYYGVEVDLSTFVPGGHPAALVAGAVIQELDTQRNPVFQWRSWDSFEITNDTFSPPGNAVHTKFHINNVNMDVDGHIIAGTPNEIYKINRQTSEVMWILGGPNNQFSVVDGDVSHFGGHGTYRIDNGNFLMYNNSDGVTTSQVHEYSLDEINKVATRVWSYIPTSPIICRITGNAQRLPNGNTFIGWGGFRAPGIPVCSEVTPAGEVVFELFFDDPSLLSYRAFRFPYPASSGRYGDENEELAAGNEYEFTNAAVTIDVNTISSGGYNLVTISNEPYAPLNPSFLTVKAPRLLPWRVTVDQVGIAAIDADIEFDVSHFGFSDPANITVYQRSTAGSGTFVPLGTTYNPVSSRVIGDMTQFGEFVFGYPDLADIANPPILCRAENWRGVQPNFVIVPLKAESNVVYSVNQEMPVSLCWSPKGLSRFSQIQIDDDASFASPIVDVSFKTDHTYVWSNAAPSTTYYWRARTTIDDGSMSAWSTSAFQTVAPSIAVTVPNGGEEWQRGLDHFIAWDDNIAEAVSIALYKDDSFLEFITTNAPSSGAYEWEPGFHLSPGDDYKIKIASVTNAPLEDMSDADFNIDVPRITLIREEPDESIVLEWAGTSAGVYVEFAPEPTGASWVELDGPIVGLTWTNSSPPSSSNGVYRLRLQ